MKVKHLIKKLQKLNPEAKVYFQFGEHQMPVLSVRIGYIFKKSSIFIKKSWLRYDINWITKLLLNREENIDNLKGLDYQQSVVIGNSDNIYAHTLKDKYI